MTFLHGCNYPWSTDGAAVFYGLDFGMNVWGSHLGISTRASAIRADFERMASLGFTIARWFVFCDGRAGIEYDGRAHPSGLDPLFFADLDLALEIAGGCGIRLDLVLLDFRWMFSGLTHQLADVTTGQLFEARLPEGRADVLLSAAGREALFSTVVVPLIARYGPAGVRADLGSAVAAYEFMNEPDFVVEEWERDLRSKVACPLPFELLAALVSRLSDTVHALHPGVLSTIGCARPHNLWAWDDDSLGLDVLELHSYPGASIYGTPARELGVRRRVIIGEFPGPSVDEYLDFALTGGYAGAWPWSFSGTDEQGRVPEAPLRRFAARHPDVVNPRSHLDAGGL